MPSLRSRNAGPIAVLLTAIACAAAPTALAAPASVPLGDDRVELARPARGAALACSVTGTPARPTQPWIVSGRVRPSQRPVAGGTARFEAASFALTRGGDRYAFTGNALQFAGSLSAAPRNVTRPLCVSAALPVGVARNGTPILPAFDAAGADQAAREVTDACGGRSDAEGRVFYRRGLRCLDAARRDRHSGLVGYARDGYAIFGPRGANGRTLTTSDLDACHGHVGRVPFHGKTRRVYHYHATGQFPYTVGCFRGRPSADWRLAARPVKPTAPAAAPPVTPQPAGQPPTAQPTPEPELEPVPPPALLPVSISADPALYPAFDREREAYVTRCDPATPVELSVNAPDGTRVAVDGRPARSGRFDTPLPLSPGQAFRVVVGDAARVTTHEVRCLPADFPAWTAARTGISQVAFHLVGLGDYAIAFDADGVPAWWYETATPALDPKLLPNGNVAYSRYYGGGYGTDPATAYEERSLTGDPVRTLTTVGTVTDHHELQVLANGNYLLLSYRPRPGVDLTAHGKQADATVYDAEIQEVTPDNALVWSWNSKDHIGLAETGRWWGMLGSSGPYDHVHINSAQEAADGDIIFSARHLDAVYRIDRSTGGIVWKLGGTATPERLGVVGDRDDAETLGAQHDARELPDGTVTVHDNRSFLPDARPRGVRYRIDEAAGTATLVESVVDADVPNSFCCGSARRLPGGNWVFNWGGRPLVSEITASGRRVFELRFEPYGLGFSYRDNPIEPGVITRQAFAAAMDAMHPRP